nr:MAG TPA: hypothetical protein [Bacteriophage sp.]
MQRVQSSNLKAPSISSSRTLSAKWLVSPMVKSLQPSLMAVRIKRLWFHANLISLLPRTGASLHRLWLSLTSRINTARPKQVVKLLYF